MTWKPAESGGPCRGRTYGPLIKSNKRPFLTKLAIAMVSPFINVCSMACAILYFLVQSVPSYSFTPILVTKMVTAELVLVKPNFCLAVQRPWCPQREQTRKTSAREPAGPLWKKSVAAIGSKSVAHRSELVCKEPDPA